MISVTLVLVIIALVSVTASLYLLRNFGAWSIITWSRHTLSTVLSSFLPNDNENHLYLACTFYQGPFSQVSGVMKQLYSTLNDAVDTKTERISINESLGIYLDNPKIVPEQYLRSLPGFILSKKPKNIKPTQQPPSSESENQTNAKTNNNTPIMIIKLPLSMTNQTISTTFPLRKQNPTLSILLGVFKVYPALQSFLSNQASKVLDEETGPIMEIYAFDQQIIQYLVLNKSVMEGIEVEMTVVDEDDGGKVKTLQVPFKKVFEMGQLVPEMEKNSYCTNDADGSKNISEKKDQ